MVRKRADGYHDLETFFYPIPLKDALELDLRPGNESRGLELTISGAAIPGKIEDNLCYKAFQLINNDFPQLPGPHLHLLKAIPSGAGIGGGSSDGAHTLLLLNQALELGLTTAQLMRYAERLGSDCPFFILNTPALATGRGEQLEPNAVDLGNYYIVLVCPAVHISTGWAFSQLVPAQPAERLRDILAAGPRQWKGRLINDFEAPILASYPGLAAVRDGLYAAGAVYASLTGSGSAIYGLFDKGSAPDLGSIARDHKVYHLKQNR